MGNCCGGSANVPPTSSPMPETAQSTSMITHSSSKSTTGTPAYADGSRHDHEITTLSHNQIPVTTERSQGSTSQRRLDDKDNPPTPPPVSNPHSQRQYLFQPRGPPSQLHKSISMDTTTLQGPRSPSSGQMTRTSSAFLLGRGPQPTGTHPVSGPASGTGQIPVDKQERQPRFPSKLQSLLPNDFRFRILVVGKPRSGKSSLINTIFNVDLSRAPMKASGSIVEFRPLDNRRLIVHECSAFGPGELQIIRDYIATRNHKGRPASERLHAIWICVPMTDAVNGQFDEGLKQLLGTGVPVVIVFTMLDLTIPNVPSHGNEYERAMTAYIEWEGHCRTLFGNVRTEIVSTQPRFCDPRLIAKLVARTDEAIIAHSRNISGPSKAQGTQQRLSAVTLAWSVSQRASHDIKIQTAIEVGQNRYWRRLGSSEDFAGQTLANCVEVIHSDIVGVWNLPDKDKYLSSTAFKVGISHLIQDLSRPPIGTSSRPKLNTQGTGAAWLSERYENGDEYHICLVVAYIVDLTVILRGIFGCHGNVSPSDVQSIMNDFATSSPKTSIHAEICRFLKTVRQFEYQDNDVVLETIIDLIRQNL